MRETIFHGFQELLVVIYAKNVYGAFRYKLGQDAPAGSTVDLGGAFVMLRHAIYGNSIHITLLISFTMNLVLDLTICF